MKFANPRSVYGMIIIESVEGNIPAVAGHMIMTHLTDFVNVQRIEFFVPFLYVEDTSKQHCCFKSDGSERIETRKIGRISKNQGRDASQISQTGLRARS